MDTGTSAEDDVETARVAGVSGGVGSEAGESEDAKEVVDAVPGCQLEL